MTESLMQKIPHGGKWEQRGWGVGGVGEGTLGLRSSLILPPLKTHLSSFLCHTPFLHPSFTFSLLLQKLLTAETLFLCICRQPETVFLLSISCHIPCHLLYFVKLSRDQALWPWVLVHSLFSQCSLAFGHTAVTVTPSRPSYMLICVGSTAITF